MYTQEYLVKERHKSASGRRRGNGPRLRPPNSTSWKSGRSAPSDSCCSAWQRVEQLRSLMSDG